MFVVRAKYRMGEDWPETDAHLIAIAGRSADSVKSGQWLGSWRELAWRVDGGFGTACHLAETLREVEGVKTSVREG